MVIYRDVKLSITPQQWADFTVPNGVAVVWDSYNFKDNTIVGRFTVSENHLKEEERKNEEFLDKFIDSLGLYVVTDNAKNKSLEGIPFGQYTVTWEGHPYLNDIPNSVDVHRSDKEKDLKRLVTKTQLEEINYTILDNANRFPSLKKYRDERLRPKEKGNSGQYEIYTAVLEEVPS